MIPVLFKHGYHIKKHAPQFELLDLYLFQSKAVLCKAAMLLFGKICDVTIHWSKLFA